MALSPASNPPPRAIIVGAGAIGLLTALQLRQRGWAVQLFDRGTAGAESSWAGGGVLSPILPWNYPAPVWHLSRRSIELYPAIAADLIQHTGVDPELSLSGAYVLDSATRVAGLAWCRLASLQAAETDLLLPAGGDTQTALSLPWIGQIRNPRLCRALAGRLRQLGVEIREQQAVTQWVERNGRVTGVRTDAGDFEADVCVLAAGAWSAQLTPLPVTPVRGQMLLLRAAPGLLPGIIIDRGRYLIPRRDGRILVGSTVEHVGFDKRLTTDARESLQAFAGQILGDAALDIETQWSGLRPGSEDGLPFIGEHPRHPGLFLNTGHYRNGLVMAPASAELLADLVEGLVTQVDADAYALAESRLRPSR